jgi:hypothetical protein
MKELTYILGAGASFQSIPVVNSFSKRFLKFAHYFEDEFNNEGFSKSELYKMLYNLVLSLHNEFASHHSFDTYFKKLFHTNQFEQIEQSKRLLNLYFLWEHLQSVSSLPFERKENTFYKESKFDKRYDALLAGLLKPESGKKEFFTKVNFITWNYDLNLFFSLKNYFGDKMPIGEFIKKIKVNEFEWNISNQVSVINMNGFFYSHSLDSFYSLETENTSSVLYDLIEDDFLDSEKNRIDAEQIKFAWETDRNVAGIAKSKIQKSNNIVVIGYTFPLYNRLQDLYYFNNKDVSQKKVYIQDPDSEKIGSFAKESFGISTARLIKTVKDCSSFFVPSDIFDESLDNYGENKTWDWA